MMGPTLGLRLQPGDRGPHDPGIGAIADCFEACIGRKVPEASLILDLPVPFLMTSTLGMGYSFHDVPMTAEQWRYVLLLVGAWHSLAEQGRSFPEVPLETLRLAVETMMDTLPKEVQESF